MASGRVPFLVMLPCRVNGRVSTLIFLGNDHYPVRKHLPCSEHASQPLLEMGMKHSPDTYETCLGCRIVACGTLLGTGSYAIYEARTWNRLPRRVMTGVGACACRFIVSFHYRG